MIAYASRTGTKRNLDALAMAGWRLMVSARGVLRTEGFAYALDNGAWTAAEEFRKGLRASPQLCLKSFLRAVAQLGARADFIVVPDIVQGGEASWAMSRYWLRRLRRDPRLKSARLMLAVQDGFDPIVIGRFLDPRVGVFVGGSTEFKEREMALWAQVAHQRGAQCHVGRVNTARRIRLCAQAKVDSFDGSSVSRFAKTVRPLDYARRQIGLDFGPIAA